MTYTLQVSPLARDDLDEAHGWYERKRAGLGDEFLQCVQQTFENIRMSPLAYAQVFESLRRAPLRRFPYGVYFRLAGERVEILAVFHASRNVTRLRFRGRN